MSQVIVVGSFNVDHVWRCVELPAVGATIAGQYSTGPGGKGLPPWPPATSWIRIRWWIPRRRSTWSFSSRSL